MKHKKEPVCPGCGKHCPMSDPRCKYGRAYFAKKAQQTQKEQTKPKKSRKDPSSPACKWEAYVTRGGLAWLMLLTLRSAKKALRRGRVDEERLLHRLTDEERLHLLALLQKLDFGQEDFPEETKNP